MSTFQQSLAKYQQLYGEDAPPCALSLSWISFCYKDLGDLASATTTLDQAAAIYRGWYSTQSPEYAEALREMAWLQKDMGQLAEAEKLLRKALGIYESIADAPLAGYADALVKLALILEINGQPARAIEVQRRALPLLAECVGRDNLNYLDAMNVLVRFLIVAKQYKPADETLQELETAVANSAAVGPRLDPLVKVQRGSWHEHQEQWPEALAAYRQSYEMFRQQLAEDSARCGNVLSNMARIYVRQHKPAEALQAYERSLTSLFNTEGPAGASTRDVCKDLVSLLQSESLQLTLNGKLDAAQKHLENCVRRATEVFGADDPYTQQTRDRLQYQAELAAAKPAVRQALVDAEIAWESGRAAYAKQEYQTALENYRRAQELREPHLAPDNLRLGELYRSLAFAYSGLKDYAQALEICKRSEPAFARFSGTGTLLELDYARTLRDIGLLHRELSQQADAADYLNRAIETYRRLKSATASEQFGAMLSLVDSYWALGDETRCLPALVQYVQRVQQVYGEQHFEYAAANRKRGQILLAFAKYDEARRSFEQARQAAAELKLDEAWDRALRYDLATLDVKQGMLEAAIAAFSELLAYYREHEPGRELLNTLGELQKLAQLQG